MADLLDHPTSSETRWHCLCTGTALPLFPEAALGTRYPTAGASTPGDRPFVMEKLVERFGKPAQLRLDNGPEFRSVEFT